ncbi:MAG TPA: HAMP domain-containing sensor histidine kinase [Nocardioidaceae bacterium]|nr:HAMP domain-containing sensor histidine kinase [Nocardioidaceae bacterium]
MTAGGRIHPALSLRLRLVLFTVVAVTAMEVVGGLLTISAVRDEFVAAASWTSRDRAAGVARLAADGELPLDLPLFDEGETLVQVVREDQVVSRSENLIGAPPLPLPEQPPGSLRLLTVERLPVQVAGPFQVSAHGARTPDGPVTVFVAVTTEDVDEVVGSAIARGSMAVVLLVVPLSLLLWVAMGRTLAPVRAIRARADAITAADLTERVPEPARMDEIGRLARTINGMLARLDASAAEQRRFLADAAHELRSPVASLRAQLETMQQSGSGSPADDATVRDLLEETLRMQTLVDQLLLLARSDAGRMSRGREWVDLDDTVASVVRSRRLDGSRLDVRVDTRAVDPVQVVGDPMLLAQVVRNLLDNALRHATSEVRVSLSEDDGSAVLVVDDDGPGVPQESRTEVFRRFTRLDEARHRDSGGVGLGLAIVADVVRVHGGDVTVTDSPTGGARFTVRLPTAAVETPSQESAPV